MSYSVKAPQLILRGFSVAQKSGPTRLTAGPLWVCTAGGIRTRDLALSQNAALSAELQRHTSWNLGVRAYLGILKCASCG